MLKTLYRAGISWSEDRGSYLGAALAYYALFSIAPLLIIAIAGIGIVFGENETKLRIFSFACESIGEDGAKAVQELVEQVWRPQTTFWASILGPIILFLTASNFFLQLGTALEMIWDIKPMQHRHWLYGLLKNYLLAFAMVILTGAFWLALFLGDGLVTYLVHFANETLPGGTAIWKWCHYCMFILLVSGMIMFTFRFLSHGKIPYLKLWFGSVVAAVLLFVGRLLFVWYLTYMGKSLTTAFGAASSVVIFLIWVYYSAQIVFFGAEVVKVELKATA
ncbi:MAG TPA: YihY/virulence factor BrkB family protein [Gemmatales bacterium]|nr:YihY/virulence factor BrkB family protein [Gemmatales bacterium]HMP15720.1 YihY/virulence factor BrkB family protein [Gemmatales bacterium]